MAKKMKSEITSDLEHAFPAHKASLTLTHNDHRDYYQTVEQWIEESGDRVGWVSDEQREKAIRIDSVWVLQWYPDTPIGSYTIAGADLDVVLALAKEIEQRDVSKG